jgi:hypothetical protein
MKCRLILMAGLAILAVPAAATADIYRWQDAAGVTHFSNEPPPAGVRVIEKTEETPHDPAADRQRIEEDRRARLESRQLDIQEQKVQAAAREREAQLRLEQERARQMEETNRQYNDDNDDSYLRYGNYYVPGYYRPYGRPGDPNLYRGYYRDNNNLYYKDPRRLPTTPTGPKPMPFGRSAPGPAPDELPGQTGSGPPRAAPGRK